LAGGLLLSQELGHSGFEVFACHRDLVARPAVVDLAPVEESMLRIKEKKVRSAGRLKSFGNVLSGIKEVRKRIIKTTSVLSHFAGRVLGVRIDIIGIDGQGVDSLVQELTSELGEFSLNVLHKGTVVANEHHQQSFVGRKLRCAVDKPKRILE
jgi:hypothetical protein